MEVKFFNNVQNDIHFNSYKNSKYSNEHTKNNILDNSFIQNNPPSTLDLDDNASIYKYSREQIRDLYRYFSVVRNPDTSKRIKKNIKRQIDTVVSKTSDCSVNSSNMEMILDLVKSKKLTPEILQSLYKGGQISRRVNDDLDKLYAAYAENKDVEDVFVPKFNSKDEALKGIKIGDVCQIEGTDNISTKLPDGTLEELFITPKTYLELFPPVERFIVNQSHIMGDCYLLAALDSINQNPNSRHKILEIFRENPDGTVDAAFGGFKKDDDGKIIQKNPEKTILKDISAQIHNNLKMNILSHTTEGFRAVELLHEKERKNQSKTAVMKQYDKYKKLKQHIKDNERISPELRNDFFFKLYHNEDDIKEMQKRLEESNSVINNIEMVYTEEELDYFCSYIEDGRYDELFYQKSHGIGKDVEIKKDDMLAKLAKLEGKNDDTSRYERLFLQRCLNFLEECDSDKMDAADVILPKKIFADIFDAKETDMLYNHAGFSHEIFEMFGLDVIKGKYDTTYHELNSPEIKKILFSEDASDYVFECSSYITNRKNDFPIIAAHSYSLEPVDIEGKRKFIVRNTHNSISEAVFTYEELNRHFNLVAMAKIDK